MTSIRRAEKTSVVRERTRQYTDTVRCGAKRMHTSIQHSSLHTQCTWRVTLVVHMYTDIQRSTFILSARKRWEYSTAVSRTLCNASALRSMLDVSHRRLSLSIRARSRAGADTYAASLTATSTLAMSARPASSHRPTCSDQCINVSRTHAHHIHTHTHTTYTDHHTH